MENATQEPVSAPAHPVVKYKPVEPGKEPGPEVSTEITVQGYISTAQRVLEITAQYTGVVYDVAAKAGMEAAKLARRELVTLRTDLEQTRTKLKAPVIQLGRDIDAQAKAITAAIVAMEDPIDGQISKEEERKKTEREAAARKEKERQEELRSRITAITQMPLTVIGKPSAFMSEVLTKLQATDTSKAAFWEYAEQAQEAVKVSSQQIATMIANQVSQEAMAAAEADAAAERRREVEAAAAAKQIDDARMAEIRAMAKLPTILLRSEPSVISAHIEHLASLNMSEPHWGARHAEAVATRDDIWTALQSILEDRIKAAEAEERAVAYRREQQAETARKDAEEKERQRVADEAQAAADARLKEELRVASEAAQKKEAEAQVLRQKQEDRLRVLRAHAEEMHACLIVLIGICNQPHIVWSNDANMAIRGAMLLVNKVRNEQ